MADSEAKGRQYIEEAKKKLTTSKGFLGGLLWVCLSLCVYAALDIEPDERQASVFCYVDRCRSNRFFCLCLLMSDPVSRIHGNNSGSSKVDEAIELYVRAGNMFKMAKCWSDAGKCLLPGSGPALEVG